ncbi:MAG: GH3 auxin-responsive promoter family protein [Candidatus Obscuribacterales bacterium]|nr:GH3 auxin-responsive promoter family protein [Candidatus Obscuribacterales bacterium]
MSFGNPLIRIGQYYRKLTHVKRFMSALADPRKTQSEKLLSIVSANKDTEFGKRYGFGTIKTIEDYQRQVPAAEYEDLRPYIEDEMAGIPNKLTAEAPVMFATTSGTTGKPKFIPITPTHLKDYAHAFQVHNWGLVRDSLPKIALPGARYLIFASNDCEGHTEAGIPYGAVSGLLRRQQSPLVARYFSLPLEISRIKDVQVKYYMSLRIALCQRIAAVMACNPSTLLLLADQLNEHAEDLIRDIFDGTLREDMRLPGELGESLGQYLKQDKTSARKLAALLEQEGCLLPRTVWPDLCRLSVWKGGPMPFYLERLPAKYGKAKIRDFGYMASEGRGTIPLSDEGSGGVAALTSHFFEFVPEEEMESEDKTFLTLDQLVDGKRYYIHFTTAAGLYRYNINDLMQVTGMEQNTPILKFVQKGVGVSSITGEKLTEEQVHVALRYAVRQLNLNSVDHFTLAVQLEHPPRYVGYVEVKEDFSQSVLEEFARVFDQSLQHQNIEYKDKRATRRLGSPTIEVVKNGTFVKLRQMRVEQGAPEAQVKIPFLASPNFRDVLLALEPS